MSPRRSEGSLRHSRPADIHTVARQAGVSVATVSRTINRIPTVDPKYAERVWAAISKLGYIPNTQARALVSGRSRIIGIIISDITNPFFPELIQSFEDEAVAANYEIMLGSTAYDSRRMQVCIDRMLQRKVDGVAVMTFGIEEPLLDRLAVHGIPLAFIDVAPKGAGMSAIKVDYNAGIREAVEHLVTLGHRRLAFISGPKSLHSAQSRKKAFLKACAGFNVDVPEMYVHTGDHTLEGGISGMHSFLKRDELPTAVVCSNDVTAIGVLHAAAAAHLRIPQDISVVGFDDIHIAHFTVPPLTTIRMPCQALAHAALNALRSHIEKKSAVTEKDLVVRTQLKVRESTGSPKGIPAAGASIPSVLAEPTPGKKMKVAQNGRASSTL